MFNCKTGQGGHRWRDEADYGIHEILIDLLKFTTRVKFLGLHLFLIIQKNQSQKLNAFPVYKIKIAGLCSNFSGSTKVGGICKKRSYPPH